MVGPPVAAARRNTHLESDWAPVAVALTAMSNFGLGKTAFAVVGYASCSSIMCAASPTLHGIKRRTLFYSITSHLLNSRRLVINKLAVHYLPAPSFVLLAQVTCSWVAVKFVGVLGFIEVDEIEYNKMMAFLPVAAAFLACIFANIKTLQFANVETFIVFRASTPLIIGITEWALMGRELPNMRSAVAMLALVAGAFAYVYTDASFVVTGYVWVGVWYAIFCFDQLYIKHAVDTVKMRSNWGRVFYTNLWASLMLLVMTVATEPRVRVCNVGTNAKTHAPFSSLHSLTMVVFASMRTGAQIDAMGLAADHRPLHLLRRRRRDVVLCLPLPRGRLCNVLHRRRQRLQDPDRLD